MFGFHYWLKRFPCKCYEIKTELSVCAERVMFRNDHPALSPWDWCCKRCCPGCSWSGSPCPRHGRAGTPPWGRFPAWGSRMGAGGRDPGPARPRLSGMQGPVGFGGTWCIIPLQQLRLRRQFHYIWLFLGACNSKTLPSWREFITLVLSSKLIYKTWQGSR